MLQPDTQEQRRRSSASSSEGEGHEQEGVEVLATLSALGISNELRSKVQEAIEQLNQLTVQNAAGGLPDHAAPAAQPQPAAGKHAAGSGPNRAQKAGPGPAPKVQTVEAKLQMSRNIMRKLHHKNVALEKELQMYKANTSPITFSQSTPEVMERLKSQPNQGSVAGAADRPGALLVESALQERDEVILQLRHALDASRRSNALLESQLAAAAAPPQKGGAANGRKGTAGRVPAKQQAQGNMLHASAQQSQMHANRYKQIRNDYDHLLFKRAGFSKASKAAPGTPQAMLMELKARLTKEMSERDAEAALYSTRLYESERHLSDWYVEKRMLEEQISHLNSEIVERDNLDQQIQSCVCGLFERINALEAENAELQRRLGSSTG